MTPILKVCYSPCVWEDNIEFMKDTWSIADWFFPWWNVETNIAKACTWFMLTLNWSCSILALSSHILERFSILLATTSAYMQENMHIELQSPSKTPISRALFDHFQLILALGIWRTFPSTHSLFDWILLLWIVLTTEITMLPNKADRQSITVCLELDIILWTTFTPLIPAYRSHSCG